jgi:hypothetical protein
LWPVSLALTGGVPLPVSLLAIPDRIPSFPPGPAEEWTYRLDSTTNETFAVWPLTEAKSEFRFQEGWWRLLAMRAEGGRIRSLEHGRTSWQLSSARTLPDGKAIDVTAAGAHLLISRPVSIELKIDPIET